MADQPDKESRTEEPTEKRLSEAIEKGNTPFSREMVTFGSLLALIFVLNIAAPWAGSHLAQSLSAILAVAGEVRLDDREAVSRLLSSLGVLIFNASMPAIGMLTAGAVLSSIIQNIPSITLDRIVPKVARISPASGFQRLYGKAGIIEFTKSVLKLTVVIIIATTIVWQSAHGFLSLYGWDPVLLPEYILRVILRVAIALCIVSMFAALADLIWTRFKWKRDLRMSRHELKEEVKQAEGNPHIKQRIRTIARQMSSRRMLSKLPTATMVVVNPTHYAVALRYERNEAPAPMVIAKGVDHLAQRIRTIAKEHDIPVIENKPLARSLYEAVEIDSEIPPEFYRAVAEVIHFINNRSRPSVPHRSR